MEKKGNKKKPRRKKIRCDSENVAKWNLAGSGKKCRFLPFSIDRAAHESLTNQLTTGFRESIRIGYYRAGDVLPSVNLIALQLGVSEIVVRGAFRRLVDEGLLSSRRKIGHTVRTLEKPLWKGHVRCVMTDLDINPQLCVIVEGIRRALSMKGYLFSQVTVLTDVKGPLDFSALDVALSRPLDFAVTVFRNHDIEKRLSAAGIPFAVIGGKG
ncbi:MAG: winged helix-turn-helix transcriptional regulator, partial [Kiritimatiellae bacterium]|nr:winged helix-turn-helix transcriptional regulator [Kiritimatiellia bacterium]